MKTFLCSFVLLFITLSACTSQSDQADSFPYDQEYLQTVADEVNKNRTLISGDIGYAFLGTGTVESRQIEEIIEGVTYSYLSLEYAGNRNDEALTLLFFDMGFELAEIPFPNFIANANITFLGDQLLVRDLDSDFAISFWAPTTDEAVNPLPKVNTELVPSLRIRTTGL